MRSGLPDYADEAFAAAANHPDKVWTTDELIDIAAKHKPTGDPGTFHYVNTNYLLLGIIEKVTGERFADYLNGGGRFGRRPPRPSNPVLLKRVRAGTFQKRRRGDGLAPSAQGPGR